MDDWLIAALIGVGGSIVGTVIGVFLGSHLSNKQNELNRLHSEESSAQDREFYKAATLEERQMVLARERLRFAESGYADVLGAIESVLRGGCEREAASAVARLQMFAPEEVHFSFCEALFRASQTQVFVVEDSERAKVEPAYREAMENARAAMRAHLGQLGHDAAGLWPDGVMVPRN